VGRPGGNSDIYIVNAEGGGSRRLTFHEARDILPSWSRNGQWIYFQSSRSGENDIWKISPEASEPVQVTINGGSYAIESLDGQTLFFSKQTDDGQRLFSMPVDGGEPTEIKLAPLNGLSFDVAVRGIFVISEPEGVASSGLHFVDFRSRQVSLITELNDPVGKISLSPDGEWILFAERDVGSSDIILVDDFR
jgi:Tol biopolymer transport system component